MTPQRTVSAQSRPGLILPQPSESEVGDRPVREKFPGTFNVWHDRALGLVYGASAGAWVELVAYACAGGHLPSGHAPTPASPSPSAP